MSNPKDTKPNLLSRNALAEVLFNGLIDLLITKPDEVAKAVKARAAAATPAVTAPKKAVASGTTSATVNPTTAVPAPTPNPKNFANRPGTVLTVDSGGCISIPAAVVRDAKLTDYVGVQLHPNSLTLNSDTGLNEELKVHPDGRVRITKRMTETIGLNPGDKVIVRLFKDKAVLSQHRN